MTTMMAIFEIMEINYGKTSILSAANLSVFGELKLLFFFQLHLWQQFQRKKSNKTRLDDIVSTTFG
jgi:hypothetical protein